MDWQQKSSRNLLVILIFMTVLVEKKEDIKN